MQSAHTCSQCLHRQTLWPRQLRGQQALSVRQSAYHGSQQGLQVNRGTAAVVMRKKDIHPAYFEEAKVMCNGEEVLVTAGTKEVYTVDIWSGNHPIFQGGVGNVIIDEGQVNRFKRRFAGLDALATVSGSAGDAKLSAADKEMLAKLSGKKVKGKGKK